MATLYIAHQGAWLRCRGGRLLVTLRGRELVSVPAAYVDHVIIFGAVHLTASSIRYLLDSGIPVSFISLHGRYRGRLEPPLGYNVTLRRAQFACANDSDFCLRFARQIVLAKLTSQYYACLRWGRQTGREQAREAALSAAQKLATARKEASRASDTKSLLGYEGAGTRAYYSALRAVVADKFPFPRRTRRPPRDPVSLILGFCSALLQARVAAAVQAAGFDPFQGFYHSHKFGKPALVLDMMEELRPVISDAVAASSINLRMIRQEHIIDANGLTMGYEGIRALVRAFERKERERVRHPELGARVNYERLPYLQARLLARLVLGESSHYRPFYLDR